MSVEMILRSLEKLEQIHKSLLELAYKKTEIIKNGDTDSLDQLLKDEQAHVAAISQLEQQRQTVVTDYLRAKGIAPAEHSTVAHVMENANTTEEREQLNTARNKLLLTVETLKHQNDLNQQLTFQSLQFINLTLDMLKPKPDQINYSRAEVQGPSKDKTYFDSKA